MTSAGNDFQGLTAANPSLFLMTNSFETGGSERQFVELAKSFTSSSFRSRIGCIAKQGAFLDELGEEILEFPLGGNLYGLRSMQMRWQLAQYLRHSKTAIAQAFDFYTNLTLIPAARMARIPVVLGSHRQLGDLLSPAKFRAQLAVFRWCDRVVCNSDAAADRLRKAGMPEKQIVVIGNGFSPEAFARTAPAFPRDPSLLRVGMIATMNAKSKNHGSFLRAAACVARTFPETEFILAGDGPLRPELERQAVDLGIRDQVRFLGDRRDIPAILASLDISVLPSLSESLSNSVLESMAAGVPVVASRVGDNSKLLSHDRGILVAAGDDDALTCAVERLLTDSGLRVNIGRNAKKFAESNFAIAGVRKRYEDLYRELLERKTWRRKSYALHSHREAALNRPLRVAIVAASSRYVGGQSVQANSLLGNWRNDPEVEATFIPIDPLLPRSLKWLESVPFLRTLVREPIYLAALWRGLRHTDIAHIFSASYWSFLLAPAPAWAVARLCGSKAIIHYHSGEARDHLDRFPTARPILAKADRLVVPSEFLVAVFREFGLTAQAVPNVVDVTQFSFRARKPLRPRLLCTRGFHPYYCVDLLVQAFAEVQRAFLQAQLNLVGAGPLEKEIRKLVEQLKLTGVVFSGAVSRERVAQFYDAADVFVNASSLDNMPVSILEAFAAGTPVVSTAPEGIRYLVEHERTGLLSEPGDWRALAENVMRLLRDPELAGRIASNAYEQTKLYRWTEVRGQWLQIYRSLANGSRVHQDQRALESSRAIGR
jgi:glycosyltransferase involved in cell wall biosynthesis